MHLLLFIDMVLQVCAERVQIIELPTIIKQMHPHDKKGRECARHFLWSLWSLVHENFYIKSGDCPV